MLVVGNQRSYSDVCQGANIKRALSGLIEWDRSISIARFSAGTTIYDIIKATGHRPPVVPGTGWATIGGCIANDVHGKNHKTAGSFGNHVTRIGLNRHSYNSRFPAETPMFKATVGGLGLTGEITWADVRLVKHNPFSSPLLFPLDYVPRYWSAYKRLKCWQYHCVIPQQALRPILQAAKNHPFLVVEKRFYDQPSIGMLSFCRPGISLSMDFLPHCRPLQPTLDNIVMEYGGAVYPAKTAMSAEVFRHSFPRWREFQEYIDPAFSSSFSQRVELTDGSKPPIMGKA